MKKVVCGNVSNPHPLKSFLKAGIFLHMMTIAELALLWVVSSCLTISVEADIGLDTFLKFAGLLFLGSLPLMSQLDARSRFQNYRQLKDQMYRYGFDVRILKPVLKSRCQRDAALAAAEEIGFGHFCGAYFNSLGYRWYHLFPEFLLKKPYFLLSPCFWRTTFFMPVYRPKVNYALLINA